MDEFQPNTDTLTDDESQGNAASRERKIYKVTVVGTVANLLLLLFKFAAGILGRSGAMIADAVHSLSDFVTDIVVLVFVRIAGKPQDSDHDYGHGKYETLATALIGAALVLVGLGLLWKGSVSVWGFFHGRTLQRPGMVALVAAFVSIIVKEGLYRYGQAKSKRLHSTLLHANAWHHRTDALSSIGSALGIGGAILLGDRWLILDPVAAILVSILIIRAAVEMIGPSVSELLEKSLPDYIERDIRNIIMSFPQVSDPHNLRTRRIGGRRSVEVHIRVNGNMTVSDSHDITKAMEKKLRILLGQDTFINIHVEPERPYDGPLGIHDKCPDWPSNAHRID